jgi:hypothetical protein
MPISLYACQGIYSQAPLERLPNKPKCDRRAQTRSYQLAAQSLAIGVS